MEPTETEDQGIRRWLDHGAREAPKCPASSKLAFIVIAGGAIAYFFIYMYGEVNHPRARPAGARHERRHRSLGRPDVRHRGPDRGRSASSWWRSRSASPSRLRIAPMQNGFYEVRVPDATDYWMRDGEVPPRLPGAHRCLRLRDRHRRRPLRGRLPHRARAQSVRLHLRTRLRRALRSRTAAAAMWMRRSPSARSSASSPSSSARRPATTRCIARPITTPCCRPIAAITSASPWSAPASPA